jgi:hypothetical protein
MFIDQAYLGGIPVAVRLRYGYKLYPTGTAVVFRHRMGVIPILPFFEE